MGIAVLIGAAVAHVSIVLAALWPVSDARRAASARAFAQKVDLGLRPDLVRSVGARLVRRERFRRGTVGVAAGALIASFGWLRVGTVGDAVRLLGFWATVLLGRGLGALTVQAMDDRDHQHSRAAHLASPNLLDFVTPVELWTTRASAFAALVLSGCALVTVRSGQRAGALALLVACALVWAVAELGLGLAARSRPVASDVQSLAFDDALRAESLRALLVAACFPLFAVAWAAEPLGFSSAATIAVLAAFMVAVVALTWGETSPQARRRFKQRLWGTPVTDPGTLRR